MPKKRRKKKDKGAERVPFYAERISEKTRDSYVGDIQNLTNRLEHYEERHRSLLERNERLELKLKSAERDEDRVIKARSTELADKGIELKELKEELSNLKHSRMSEGLKAEKRIQELKMEIQEVKESLLAENERLAVQLRSLEDFKARKNHVESRVTRLQRDLEEKKVQHEQTVDLMKKLDTELRVQTRDEAIEKLSAVAGQIKREAADNMPELLRRAIAENSTAEGRLEFVAKETERTEKENRAMRRTTRENDRLLERLEKRERELVRELVSAKRAIGLLQESLDAKLSPTGLPVVRSGKHVGKRLQAGDPVQVDKGVREDGRVRVHACARAEEQEEDHLAELESENKSIRDRIEKMRREQQFLEKSGSAVRTEIERLKERAKDADDANDTMKGVVTRAAELIKKSLFGRPPQSSPLLDPVGGPLVEIHRILTEGCTT